MIKGLFATFLAFAAIPSHASSNSHEWSEAATAMRNYCMSEVCLGMSVDDVSRIPGGTMTIWKSSQWERNCSGTYANWAHADFVTKDGTKLLVGFRDFPGQNDTNHRFRVQSVSIYLEVTPSEIGSLIERITSRYSMQSRENESIAPIEEWYVSDRYFDVVLNSSFKYIPGKSLLVLSAKADRYPDWMRAQTECSHQNQKVPNL